MLLGKENLLGWKMLCAIEFLVSLLWYLHVIISQVFHGVLFQFPSLGVLLPSEVTGDLQGLCT